MITFGLTGGIGSGKSTATKTFQSHGIPLIDADIVAREVVELDTYGLQQIIVLFGHEYINEDGTLNRSKFGRYIFANAEARAKLDNLMGPLIKAQTSIQIRKLHSEGHPIVGFDCAILIEMGQARKYQPLIVVHCTLEQQIERLLGRGLTRDEAVARINCQMPTNLKLMFADFAIDTSQDKDFSIKQTEIIIEYLKNLKNNS